MEIKITQNIYKYVASLVRNQFRVGRRLSPSSVVDVNHRKSDRPAQSRVISMTNDTCAYELSKSIRPKRTSIRHLDYRSEENASKIRKCFTR